MLVQTKFEVHPHDGKIFSAGGKLQVKGRLPFCSWLEQAKDRLRISKDVGWTQEASQASMDCRNRHLGADGCRGTLRVRQLVTMSDGAKRNVVSHDLSDGRLDLFGGRAE